MEGTKIIREKLRGALKLMILKYVTLGQSMHQSTHYYHLSILRKFVSSFTFFQTLTKTREWQEYIFHDRNKDHLCNLLSNFFTSSEIITNKTIYITRELYCFAKRNADPLRQVPKLSCHHREVDHNYA